MHQELEALRRALKQKIFVGQPAGEAFAEARPAERLQRMREQVREDEMPEPSKGPPRKAGQGKLEDYERQE